MIKQKFQETSTFGMIRHGLKELGNYKSLVHLGFVTQRFFVVVSDLICWNRCGLVGKFQNVHNRPSILKQSM
jgi:hypothetical protein